MNFNSVIPQPSITVFRPHKISNTGNLYRIPVIHKSADGNQTQNFEVWATREAVQQHFNNTTGEEPRAYDLKKFARIMYEKQLRTANPQMQQHRGVLITTDHVIHGNPALWPSAINHPEVKV